MDILGHLFLFVCSAGILWFFSGLLIEAVEAVAKRFNRSGFTVAFFVLGFLTSIGEFAVMSNSLIKGVPQISVGNLIGSTFVTLLFTVPLLAILGRGIRLQCTLNKKQLAAALGLALLPALLSLDGEVRMGEGVLCLIAYATLFYFIEGRNWHRKKKVSVPELIEDVETKLTDTKRTTRSDVLRIIGGAVIIFVAGNLLVDEAVYFADIFNISNSLVGLLILSVGTNIPEIVIALHAVGKGNLNIAFGNYLGSTVAVTAIFGLLAILGGGFVLDASSLVFTTVLMVFGLGAFYAFASSKDQISRIEGVGLVSFYVVFLLMHVIRIL